jgi:hypothetical protein
MLSNWSLNPISQSPKLRGIWELVWRKSRKTQEIFDDLAAGL